MLRRRRSTVAWPLTWAYLALVAYASLYPFEDWRNQDIAPWSFVLAPWPKYNTWFDINSNVFFWNVTAVAVLWSVLVVTQ
jgi:hypothetical protein